MKKIFASLLSLSIMALITISCNQNTSSSVSTANENETIENSSEAWKLVWADEFEGETLDTNNWNRQIVKAGRFNEEWQRYTNSTENAYIEDNQLVIQAIHESDEHGLDQYTSARLNTAMKQTWKYGKIAACIKLPQGQGIWPAFWMLGANINENGGDTPWPQCGEIDILEMYGSKDNAVVEGNIHYANEEDKHEMMGAEAYKLKDGIFADDFHVFELDWSEEKMEWFVDGKKYASVAISDEKYAEFHEEFFILLNLAVGGTYADYPDETTVFPQKMYVDWIKVYQKNDE